MTSQQWRRRDVPAVEPLRKVLVRQGDGDGAAEEDVRVAHEGVSHDVQDERVELGGRGVESDSTGPPILFCRV